MDILTQETVQIGIPSTDKVGAIKLAGELLVKAGCTSPEYVAGMLAREKTMSTYIGNGVAIPHGQFDDKANIYKTGISVVQFPEGVEWNPEEIAHLVIGIAATSDEHVGILANLAEVLEDPEAASYLAHTPDPQVIIERLNRPQPVEEDS
jgi:mannitol PTS system EIIA component